MTLHSAIDSLSSLVVRYHAPASDRRALYFRGVMLKAIDSLKAIDILIEYGAIWPVHSRWLVEALGIAIALNEDEKVVDQLVRESMNTFLLVDGLGDKERAEILRSISTSRFPDYETLFKRFEEEVEARNRGLLYSCYRLLCEHAHSEYHRIISYPRLGPEEPSVLAERRALFTNISIASALSIPCLAHCPPSCGFDDLGFQMAAEVCQEGWKQFQTE